MSIECGRLLQFYELSMCLLIGKFQFQRKFKFCCSFYLKFSNCFYCFL